MSHGERTNITEKKWKKILLESMIFLGLWLILFMVFSWRILVENFSLLSGISQDMPESRYNTALAFAKEKRYDEARVILERLVQSNPEITARERVYELYGDVLYLSSGSKDDVKKLYILARDIRPNDMLLEKIALLDGQSSSNSENASGTVSNTGNIAFPSGSGSGTSSLQSALDSLAKTESEKQKYLYPLNTTPENLSDTRKFLDEGVERVDW
ncbi:MAG: tetratricopeptide repeat protein [Candidatus Gracilibacteria bacterium]|nr:tetratricopeptide repeat protein [Candidatus Gracilibacteria bacterium]